MYNYRVEMMEDIRREVSEYLEWNGLTDSDIINDDGELYDAIYDDLWVSDGVTGNGSGSYTFCRDTASDYVFGNMALCIEALTEFGVDGSTALDKFKDGDTEYLDVSIRCYLLSEVLSEVFEEYRQDHRLLM